LNAWTKYKLPAKVDSEYDIFNEGRSWRDVNIDHEKAVYYLIASVLGLNTQTC